MIFIFETPVFLQQGIIIAITGYVIVFAALVILFFVFSGVSKLLLIKTKRHLAKSGKLKNISDKEIRISGEVSAAIAMAIYLNTMLHDDESDILTIKKVSKVYSPWSSKIYSLRNFNKS